jgi:hypothetical protein
MYTAIQPKKEESKQETEWTYPVFLCDPCVKGFARGISKESFFSASSAAFLRDLRVEKLLISTAQSHQQVKIPPCPQNPKATTPAT